MSSKSLKIEQFVNNDRYIGLLPQCRLGLGSDLENQREPYLELPLKPSNF